MPGQRRRVLDLHATIHRHLHVAGAEERSHVADLGQHGRDERLTAEAGVDRHHEDEIEIVEDVRKRLGVRCRVERDARPGSQLANLRQRALQMRRRLDVDRDDVGARPHEIADGALRLHDHQVDVEWEPRTLADGLHHHRADGEIRHEVAVHDVDVKLIGPARFDPLDVVGERREIGREDRRGDLHGRILTEPRRVHRSLPRRKRTAVNPSMPWWWGRQRRNPSGPTGSGKSDGGSSVKPGCAVRNRRATSSFSSGSSEHVA